MLKRDDPAWRKEYQRKYYLANRGKALEYQKQWNAAHKKQSRGRIKLMQLRPPVLFELHIGHLQDATGDRFVKYINDILAWKRMLV